MIQDVTKIRVRYGETDQMGYVYHGNYALYLEVARVELLRKMGLSYKKIEENGVILPVASLEIKYIAPAKYDDELSIHTKVSTKPSSKIVFDYEIKNEKGKLLSICSTKLACVDMKTGKLTDPPKNLVEIFEENF